MEQQKILWVILSVAILLLAVLGSAFFIFGNSFARTEPAAMASNVRSGANRFDAVEWARTGREYPTLHDITLQGNNETDFVVSADSRTGADSVTVTRVTEEPGRVVVSLPVKQIEQPRAAAATPAPAAAARPPAQRTEPAPARAAAPPSAAAPARPAAAPSAAAPARPAAPPARTVTNVREYWIQTNSFLTISRAEEERRVITSKGFPAVIQTRVDGNRTFYRVRVGAYSTRAEAEKFLYWIQNINGFEGSQIFEVTARREL
ncbi:MAG: SPOR domain-containing protein [Spirochaetes bacterium]|nr:SPOR domain-containing protein [Spirochaetota bacterium]